MRGVFLVLIFWGVTGGDSWAQDWAHRTATPNRKSTPRPAVARIVVPERGAVSYGSGTLIDVRDNYGLVVTNWHVVRDAVGDPEVVFPDGFRSKARPLKTDREWDLAALVIWRPPVEPVPISTAPPPPGEWLTICGYGQGEYREATGRVTQYAAPRPDFPYEMVELSVQARQGDSGGPILNQRGEIAGVLFGASHGTTLGSYGGRVGHFLASLADDIGRTPQFVASRQQPEVSSAERATPVADPSPRAASLASLPTEPDSVQERPATLTPVMPEADSADSQPLAELAVSLPEEPENEPAEIRPLVAMSEQDVPEEANVPEDQSASEFAAEVTGTLDSSPEPAVVAVPLDTFANDTTQEHFPRKAAPPTASLQWNELAGTDVLQQGKSILAILGVLFLFIQFVRLAV